MIRVLIVDDERLLREGLRMLLSLEPDIEVVAVAADGQEALDVAGQIPVDVVLLDIRMPRMDGIAALQALRSQYPHVRILMLTTYDDRADIVDALHAGAMGYLLKDMAAEEIAEAIRTAYAGGAVLPPRIAREFLEAVRGRGGEAPSAPSSVVQGPCQDTDLPREPLTDREREVLRCLALGMSNREIAECLHVTEGTVKNHVSSIISKLGLRDRTQAALYAVRHGFV